MFLSPLHVIAENDTAGFGVMIGRVEEFLKAGATGEGRAAGC